MEFRVRWQRHPRPNFIPHDGKPAKPTRYSALYQTEKAAQAKVTRLLETDAIKDEERDEFGRPTFDFPDLTAPPTIERRTVGEWEST